MASENIIKAIEFVKKYNHILIYIFLLAIIIYSGFYIRTLNMGGLTDVATGKMTLAPDLDPYLYLRWAKEIVANGSIPSIDTMRYVPLGFVTTNELTLPAYLIVDLYKFLNIFSPTSIEYAAVIYPVIFFCLFLIAFFLFVQKTFSGYKGSGWMAVISTAMVSIIPGLLHRTLAGVPEKEAGGLFLMFLSLYFLMSAFKSDKTWKSIMFGGLAGLSTGIMGLLWGGVTFMFAAVPLGVILMFLFSELKMRDVIAYACWAIGFTIPMLFMTTRYGIGMISPVLGGFAYAVLALLISGKIFKKKIIAFAVLTAIGLAGILIINPQLGGHSFFQYLIQDIWPYITKPFASDRITMTVAENTLAYFGNWLGSFGIAVFWFFMIGIIFLSYETFEKLGSKGKLLGVSFVVLIISMIFSRYSAATSSDLIFFIGVAFFAICLFIAGRVKDNGEKSFIDKNILLLLAVTIFSVFCSRSAIRLFYFVYPIVPIFIGYLVVRIISYFKDKNEVLRYMSWFVLVIMLLTIPAAMMSYNNGVIYEASASKTNYYEAQWQMAMQWVRENTSHNAVFAHWWDYGYWVQTIGERATVLDGGNSISYWNYLMGRLVLTGNNETAAFEYLKTHKATHLLIDSTDIGKYPAYATIGSNEEYDRVSSMQSFILDETGTQEKRNETVHLFRGYSSLEEDIIWKGKIYPAGSGIAAFLIPISTENSTFGDVKQPSLVIISQGKQDVVPFKCIYVGNQKLSFDQDSGIEGCFYTMPYIGASKVVPVGAGLWLSPRLLNSNMVHLYILDKNITGFVKVHSEGNPIVDDLNSRYGFGLPEIIFHQQAGLVGPIKIWELNYSAYPDIKENSEYLSRTYNKSLWEVN